MKYFLFVLLISQACFCRAQKLVLFDSLHFDSSYTIVGVRASYNKEKIYDNYGFIISTPSEFAVLKERFVFDKKTSPIFEENSFYIHVLRNKQIQKSFVVNPKFSNINTTKGFFVLDLSILEELSKKYSLVYEIKNISFRTAEEFFLFKAKAETDSSFLFMYNPELNYNGSFKVKVQKSESFPHPSAAIKFLQALIEEKSPKNQFQIVFIANEENFRDLNTFTLTVRCVKTVFDNYNDKVFKKSKWFPQTIEATTYWKKS